MNPLVVLACTLVLVYLLNKSIKNYAPVFYGLAACAVVFFLLGGASLLPKDAGHLMRYLIQRGAVAMSLFTIVMYIGVLSRTNPIAKSFRSIRAELSIIASILILGHMGFYFKTFLLKTVQKSSHTGSDLLVLFLLCSLTLLVLVLGFTSFRFVKRRMHARTWKKIQNFAYLFYLLIPVHLMFILGPSAARGGRTAQITIAIYAVIFGSYLVLRILRERADRKAHIDLAQTVIDQGFTEL